MKTKYFLSLLAAIFFLCFIIWMIDLGRSTDVYISEIKSSYKGVIIDKYVRRTTILTIRITSGEIIKVSVLCEGLKKKSRIGDNIEKIINENYVFLKKDSSKLKLPFIYIPQEVREDPKWPKEWKDRWLESTI